MPVEKYRTAVVNTRIHSHHNDRCITGYVLSWLQHFFSGHTHQTKLGDSLSDVLFLLSGVIQGSAIGPLMFLIFINELISLLEQHDISVKLFAEIPHC